MSEQSRTKKEIELDLLLKQADLNQKENLEDDEELSSELSPLTAARFTKNLFHML